jgi:hypothetical protein
MKYSPSTIEVFVGFLGSLIERLGSLNFCGKMQVLRRKQPSAAKVEFIAQQLCTA